MESVTALLAVWRYIGLLNRKASATATVAVRANPPNGTLIADWLSEGFKESFASTAVTQLPPSLTVTTALSIHTAFSTDFISPTVSTITDYYTHSEGLITHVNIAHPGILPSLVDLTLKVPSNGLDYWIALWEISPTPLDPSSHRRMAPPQWNRCNSVAVSPLNRFFVCFLPSPTPPSFFRPLRLGCLADQTSLTIIDHFDEGLTACRTASFPVWGGYYGGSSSSDGGDGDGGGGGEVEEKEEEEEEWLST
ncbi:unnamed protein product [Hydatigera taeniaeformis]|uniref:Ig-like domain-containing protein n=1 Tax=Hydatigena taeniaeformis TaxID=6205 RepID=A0A0R3X4T3_HYDTA|nr:unnamed protein product [Hydatigera taeniaeformis]